jgi:hypothetical protein
MNRKITAILAVVVIVVAVVGADIIVREKNLY